MEKLKVIETGILSVNDIDKLKELYKKYCIEYEKEENMEKNESKIK